ncbi:MAG: hypothetical protein COA50_03870 [Flavobacteriaceae bacterium]|nr:MAG: hypothetical protein COA50_03870 [Flavobacteriaceae bacterium]
MMKTRILKIAQKFRRRAWDSTTVPEIKLQGKWLAALGFRIGDEVVVTEEENKLTICWKDGEEG